MKNYLIVGAGLTGCVLAEKIANVLKKEILLIDRRNHIGGNCYDYRDKNGIIVHKYGPHVFHTDDKEVFEYLSQFTDWLSYEHKVLAFIEGKKVPIPFNFNSIDILFPKNLGTRIRKKLLKNFSSGSKVSVLELMRHPDSELRGLADFVYKKVFLNYTIKQWGKKPEEIEPHVIERVPIYIDRDDRYFKDKYQAIPKDGYTKIFKRMLNNPKIKVVLNCNAKKVIRVDLNNKKIYFDKKEFSGIIVYTGMLDELFDYKFGILPYRSLRFLFKTIQKEFFQEVATVNYPNDFKFTRITEYKHFHPVKSDTTKIAYEYPVDYAIGKTPYYPMFTKEAQENYYKYLDLSTNFKNLIVIGRLAEYKYYDMDDAIRRALNVFEEKIK